MGLIIRTNSGYGADNSFQFERRLSTSGHYLYRHAPGAMRGTEASDLIAFTFNRDLYMAVKIAWQDRLAYGVKQRRLVSGELILEVARGGEMLTAEWDVIDRRVGVPFKESATGVIAMSAELTAYDERWTLTLFRGDYLLKNGQLEAAEYARAGAG